MKFTRYALLVSLVGCQTIPSHNFSSFLSQDDTEECETQDSSHTEEHLDDANLCHGDLFQWPLRGKLLSPFGKRGKRFHKGIDIKGKHGEQILASQDGVVTFSGWKKRYGKVVIIRHANTETLYAHCQNLIAKPGDVVSVGQLIATVGASGNARGAHLHFEIRHENGWLNPLEKLPTEMASHP
jgi:murein DD-endopeptidase MepM/ murein hydrolase activator NlpD